MSVVGMFGLLTAASLSLVQPPAGIGPAKEPAPESSPSVEIEAKPGEPGSGAPLLDPLRPPELERLKAPLPRRPRDAAEAEGVAELERLQRRYEDAHASYADTVAHLLVAEAETGRRALDAHFDALVEGHRGKARTLRAQAIERYEAFLKEHDDDVTWTPEIMFRLAELEFEDATERFAHRENAYDKEFEAYQALPEDERPEQAPVAPTADYSRPIARYHEVVARFPHYPFNDAALYMMGTLHYEQEDFERSRQSYLALACANRFSPPAATGDESYPDFRPGDYKECAPWVAGSRFASEAWLRVGEVHYDFDELDPAVEAYAAAAADPDAKLYAEALIRLAWALYLRGDFSDAAAEFDRFVVYADARADDPNATAAVSLRDDAIKYLAKTYAEEDWNQDGRPDPVWGLERLDRDYLARRREPHVPEIYAALGDLFAYQTDFRRAIGIWESTLRRWPLARRAPAIQLKVLQAYDALQDKEGATRARDALATNYLKGTRWFRKNENDPEAIEEGLKLAEEALVATALDHHQRAQSLRGTDEEQARIEYAIAARAYDAYLERFPDTESSYEYRFNFAESLFYSDQFADAALQYELVRDSNIDNRLQKDAAIGVVASYEGLLEASVAAGSFVLPEPPKKDSPGPFERPKPMPELVLALQDAYDAHVDRLPDSEQTPTLRYQAGLLSQRYHHFDDAEKRFSHVLEAHCRDNVAINAGQAILDGYIARGDLDAVRMWTGKLTELGCGEGDAVAKFVGELKGLGQAVRYQEAMMLFEAGEYEAAADRFVALVDEAPDDPNADGALNNAAVAYEKMGRFDSARRAYERIYTNYADSEYADDALARSGYNHVRFFEYEEAVAKYLVLAEDPRYADSDYRSDALLNAADVLVGLQDYKRAAGLYRRYAREATDPQKGAEAAFLAAEATAKTGDHRAAVRAFGAFARDYHGDPSQRERVVEARLREGKSWAAVKKERKAVEAYNRTVTAYAELGIPAASDAADAPAEAQFLLAEQELQRVLRTQLKSTGRRLEKETKELFDAVVAAAAAYESVYPYRRLDWVLAAMYRRGYAFETMAIKLREAPVPKSLAEYSEAWMAYKDIVGQAAERFEVEALKLYEEALVRAKQYNFASEWTRAAQERLNIYKPDEYPLLKPPALEMQLEDLR